MQPDQAFAKQITNEIDLNEDLHPDKNFLLSFVINKSLYAISFEDIQEIVVQPQSKLKKNKTTIVLILIFFILGVVTGYLLNFKGSQQLFMKSIPPTNQTDTAKLKKPSKASSIDSTIIAK